MGSPDRVLAETDVQSSGIAPASRTYSFTIPIWTKPSATLSTSTASETHYGLIRWYDPITGRWISKDPIGIDGGPNQYVFCAGNPVNFCDPLGLVDLNLTEPGSKEFAGFEKMNVTDGSFSVGVHYSFNLDALTGLTLGDLARRILAHQGYSKGQTVTLATCEGGLRRKDGSSLARDLADLLTKMSGLPTTVVSPTTKLWVTDDGRHVAATEEPWIDKSGQIQIRGKKGVWLPATGTLVGRE